MKSKGLSFVLLLAVMLCAVLALASCDSSHTHTPGEWITDSAATCTTDGHRHNECTDCGEVVNTESIPATGHSYVDGVCTVCGELKPSEGLKFLSNENGTCRVSGIGTCMDTSIVIPEFSPKGQKVTIIDDGAFEACSSLISVTIPDSVTSIGEYAFWGCSSLESITIPDSVTSIGDGAFFVCSSLKYNEYDNAYYLGNDSNPYLVLGMAKDTSITSCTINSNTRVIDSSAFLNCYSLTSITIPDGVISIGGNAFLGCYSLTSITIPNSVTSIGNGAFAACSLTSMTLPFVGATKDGISNTHFGYIFGAGSYSHNDYAPASLKSVVITGSSSIGSYAFYYCDNLTSITIMDEVTSIGYSAFGHCSSLESVTIGNGVTSIGYYAFERCSSLESVTIGNGVTSIGGYAFNYCTSLTSVTIPDSVTSIGDRAFYGCSNLAIYCVSEWQPSGWDAEWNYSNRPVVWGHKDNS